MDKLDIVYSVVWILEEYNQLLCGVVYKHYQ